METREWIAYIGANPGSGSVLYQINAETGERERLAGGTGQEVRNLNAAAGQGFYYFEMQRLDNTIYDPYVYDVKSRAFHNLKDIMELDAYHDLNLGGAYASSYEGYKGFVFKCDRPGNVNAVCSVGKDPEGKFAVSYGTVANELTPIGTIDVDGNTKGCYAHEISPNVNISCFAYYYYDLEETASASAERSDENIYTTDFTSDVFFAANAGEHTMYIAQTNTHGRELFVENADGEALESELVAGTTGANVAWAHYYDGKIYVSASADGNPNIIHAYDIASESYEVVSSGDGAATPNPQFVAIDQDYIYLIENLSSGEAHLVSVSLNDPNTRRVISSNSTGMGVGLTSVVQVSDTGYTTALVSLQRYGDTPVTIELASGQGFDFNTPSHIDASEEIKLFFHNNGKVIYAASSADSANYLHSYDVQSQTSEELGQSKVEGISDLDPSSVQFTSNDYPKHYNY